MILYNKQQLYQDNNHQIQLILTLKIKQGN